MSADEEKDASTRRVTAEQLAEMGGDVELSTRRVSADEMDQLQELLEKAREPKDVVLHLDSELHGRVAAASSALDVDGETEAVRLSAAVRKIFLAGLEKIESDGA